MCRGGRVAVCFESESERGVEFTAAADGLVNRKREKHMKIAPRREPAVRTGQAKLPVGVSVGPRSCHIYSAFTDWTDCPTASSGGFSNDNFPITYSSALFLSTRAPCPLATTPQIFPNTRLASKSIHSLHPRPETLSLNPKLSARLDIHGEIPAASSLQQPTACSIANEPPDFCAIWTLCSSGIFGLSPDILRTRKGCRTQHGQHDLATASLKPRRIYGEGKQTCSNSQRAFPTLL